MLDYLGNFPVAHNLAIKIYAPLSSETLQALRIQLAPVLKSLRNRKGRVAEVNFILRFVQTAFTYQTDFKRENREHYYFAEQTLHSKTSDCDDRAALFVTLARELLNLDTLAIWWKKSENNRIYAHVAAAVHLTNGQGKSFRYRDGKLYYITDPTYINADMGQIMPRYQRTDLRVVSFGDWRSGR